VAGIGTIGIWRVHQAGFEGVEELEGLGYGALWLGGSPGPVDARPFLERTSTLTVATGILNVWSHDPADVAPEHAALNEEFGGRFLLGIGIGHPEATAEYRKPLATMRAFFDGLDAAEPPVPRDQRVAAALGPKMLDLAAEQRVQRPTGRRRGAARLR
jgi:probable F420-dependent oxidoreductase